MHVPIDSLSEALARLMAPDGPAAQAWLAACGLAGLAWALWRRPWHLLRRGDLQHGWLGALLFVTLLWTARVALPGGLVFQLFGATLMVTLFGLPLALLSLFVVDLVSLLGLGYLAGANWSGVDWAALWPRYVWMGLLPALLSAALQGAMRRLLPRHPFVFILGHGYFAAGLAALGAGAARAVWHSHGARGGVLTLPDTLTAVLILAFGEAFLTGMLVAVFVVYKPQWVVTFRDEEYLKG
nr:energy-coupling factor ABC transporter permease [Cupriavidus basilensis]